MYICTKRNYIYVRAYIKKYIYVQAYNKKLLSNILPVHVAEFFMSGDKNNDVSTILYKGNVLEY